MSYLDWHVGMKVVCVGDDWDTVYPDFTYPTKGRVYTITDIAKDYLLDGRVFEGIWIALAEAHGPGDGRPEFSASRFRPVQIRKTDISIFTQMLNPLKVEA